MKLLLINSFIKKYLILFLIIISSNLILFTLSSNISLKNNNNLLIRKFKTDLMNKKTSYRYELKLKKYKKNPIDNNIFVKFILGFGVGYGLSVDASEDLKKCFISHRKEQTKSIKQFFKKANREDLKHISEKDKLIQKDFASSFVKMTLELLAHLKKCPAFAQTFLTFVKYKIISLTVKGLAYVLAGPLGILLKGTYDVYKLITEIIHYYKLRTQLPFDFFTIGSSVGKIIYYAQSLLLVRRR